MAIENRRHDRFPVEMRVKARLPAGDVEAYTSTVSRGGFGLRLGSSVELGQTISFIVYLPTNRALLGRGVCRNVVGGAVGFEAEFDANNRPHWDAFIDQEESTGSLWRMIGRYTSGGSEDGSARDLVIEGESATELGGVAPVEGGGPLKLRFHTVGENGEAYRVAFEKHSSIAAIDSDLVAKYPGFKELAERAVGRMLERPVIIRQGTHASPQEVRVVELTRGGYGFLQGGEGRPVALVSLGLGETILIEVNGEPVFPHFEEFDLERIACDTFRQDSAAPMFGPAPSPAPAPDAAPPPTEGQEAIRLAQDRATQVETRRYGEREIDLYPQVWAKAKDKNGNEVMGPSMRDGDRLLLLVLVGSGAPRVLRIAESTPCSLMQRR